jgi:hypothetical protein
MDLTHFLARLIGLYCIIMSLVMLVRKPAIMELVMGMIQDRPLLFVVQIFGLVAGLAMVLAHSLWFSGLLALVVTLIGWLTLIRNVVWLFLPAETLQRFMMTIRFEQNFVVFGIVTLVIGVYLTASGFAT